jgi:hypothetical protein
MKTIKSGRPLIDFIKLCYGADRPPLLIGKHGIGKSEILQQAAEELGIDYICRDLSLMEPPDLIGLPKLDGNVTKYLPPAFLPTEGKGLLVFEELNRCQTYMRAPCLQLLTARTLNDYRLPQGWLPCAAINPADADYDVHELDPALLSRFVQVEVVADHTEWLSWAESRKLHSDVVGYVATDRRIFQDSNPRAWGYVSDLLGALEGGKGVKVGKDVLEAAVAGTVGSTRAVAFREFRKGHGGTVPDAAKLLASYGGYRRQVQEWGKEGKTDRLDAVARSIMLLLQPESDYQTIRNDKKQWKALGDFLKDLPPDLADNVRSFLRERDREVPPAGRRKA